MGVMGVKGMEPLRGDRRVGVGVKVVMFAADELFLLGVRGSLRAGASCWSTVADGATGGEATVADCSWSDRAWTV